ncbi:hypothetical protein [Pseudoalteromonas sp. SW0106-04]|uniref:hypothetical protein n=1 Tax=Pseudoalteromonas sp. SW0106-04 TaxID=1702169 RepID=UPI0006B54324|nr:hypothetical protein [Pseudoalteromonas sp. SW0106-04]
MGFKVNHYAAKTINRTFSTDWETLIIELIIGGICAYWRSLAIKQIYYWCLAPQGSLAPFAFWALPITYTSIGRISATRRKVIREAVGSR